MSSMLGKLRDTVFAVSVAMLSQDTGRHSDLPDVERELEEDVITQEVSVPVEEEESVEIMVQKDDPVSESVDDGSPEVLDLSVTELLTSEQRGCSPLSNDFQTTYCMKEDLKSQFTTDQNRLSVMYNDRGGNNSRFKAFDCGDVEFSTPKENDMDKPNESWRCLGNFNIVSGENWSVKGSASVKQDMTDIPNSDRFGVCPEGDIDCVGWGVEFNMRLAP